MRWFGLALALVLAGPVRAEDEVLDVAHATVTLQDGRTVAVSEGCWVSTRACLDTARDVRRLQVENEELRQHAGDAPLVKVLVALALGVGLGFTAARLAH
ncbi:hypothetical protein FJV41_10065 [Myxococcus llanfairpwllgwyngyllgogerychwyrndrobwllllantysiliogogogochensis]|uniref:Lipoprotein n=1 Tax=Myxococcus llanfairpwllgwyngyllgogerychwyrndrobwllllantysiliogogogochensis TaxID=2590453 RepID=A0A540X4F0_9BACT|nr:hypothetical protein [Myxococcus llanfairpwllgwyngyllgogerychwyrndrobwllllantysiliogogogochensis]TQF16125.1 hypothetical protein FJV41_10065 [Myxococcus llanfairpwllgwyngyllgogerychwyrndrobwllllantysiliogogogochensis]